VDATKNQYLFKNFIEFEKKPSDFNNGCAKWALQGETRNQILTNFLRKAFMRTDPKSVKKSIKLSFFCAFGIGACKNFT